MGGERWCSGEERSSAMDAQVRSERREARSERRQVGDWKWEVRGCERRDARGERHGGGSEECSVFCSLELPAKNKNPTLRIWGTRTPHLGCGEK